MLAMMRKPYSSETITQPLSLAYLGAALGRSPGEMYPVLPDAKTEASVGCEFNPNEGELERMYTVVSEGVSEVERAVERRERMWTKMREKLAKGHGSAGSSLRAVRDYANGMILSPFGSIFINGGRPPTEGTAENVVRALFEVYEKKRAGIIDSRMRLRTQQEKDGMLFDLILDLSSKLLFLHPMRGHNERVFGLWLINRELLRARNEMPSTKLWPMFNFYDARWTKVGDKEYLRAEILKGQDRFRRWWEGGGPSAGGERREQEVRVRGEVEKLEGQGGGEGGPSEDEVDVVSPPTASDFLAALKEDASRVVDGSIFHNKALLWDWEERWQRAQKSFVAKVVLDDRFLQDDGKEEHEATRAARNG